jgi:hypothetical protein
MAKQTKPSRREYWQQVIQRQRASGLSIERFCQRERLATATFFAWKRRLRQERPAGPASMSAAVNFAAVRVVPEPPGPVPAGTLEIVLGRDRRIRLVGPVDRTMLAEVVAVLEGRSSC